MIMVWFIPVGILIGAVGSHTAWKARHVNNKDRAWWLLLILSWLPLLCWVFAQFVDQW